MNMRLWQRIVGCAVLLAAVGVVRAQEAPEPDASPVSSAPAPDEPMVTGAVVKVHSNLVSLYFLAYGRNYAPVDSLTKDDCILYEDKVPQTIKSFERVANLPLTIGILLDTSGSQQRVLPMEKDSGTTFLKRIMTPKDQAFLISFDVNVDLLTDFTSNPREIERAMDKAQINVGGGFGNGGIPGLGQGPVSIQKPKGTVLYDAVYLAAHDKLRLEGGRKVIVLLTDGEDEGSQETLKTALEAAQKSNVIVYCILLADRVGYAQAGMLYEGDRWMRQLTEETGGRVIDVGTNGRKLEDAFAQIEDELRTQYLASYTPLNLNLDGKFRSIKVECKDVQRIQTRKGYYAVAEGGGE